VDADSVGAYVKEMNDGEDDRFRPLRHTVTGERRNQPFSNTPVSGETIAWAAQYVTHPAWLVRRGFALSAGLV
jgi:hypothetical protein